MVFSYSQYKIKCVLADDNFDEDLCELCHLFYDDFKEKNGVVDACPQTKIRCVSKVTNFGSNECTFEFEDYADDCEEYLSDDDNCSHFLDMDRSPMEWIGKCCENSPCNHIISEDDRYDENFLDYLDDPFLLIDTPICPDCLREIINEVTDNDFNDIHPEETMEEFYDHEDCDKLLYRSE